MALPPRTPEQRAAALDKAMEARRERSALLAGIRDGTLTLHAVLERSDLIAGKTRVQQVLRAMPNIGESHAKEIMNNLGISEGRRIQGLGPRQCEGLRELFPAPSSSAARVSQAPHRQTLNPAQAASREEARPMTETGATSFPEATSTSARPTVDPRAPRNPQLPNRA